MAMHLRIVCPESSAYEGDCAFVTIPSSDGSMGVLPNHASEICTITPGLVTVCDAAMGSVDHRFAVWRGYAQVSDNQVIILAERAQDLADVDVEEVRSTLQDFEDKLSNLSDTDARRSYLYNEIAWCKLLLANVSGA